jgi:hypothetical protein
MVTPRTASFSINDIPDHSEKTALELSQTFGVLQQVSNRATVVDPTVYTQLWTVEFPMEKSESRVFEYACHEGNYGLVGILSGAREGEGRTEEIDARCGGASHKAEPAELLPDINHLHRNQRRNHGGTERNFAAGCNRDRFRPVPWRFRSLVPL